MKHCMSFAKGIGAGMVAGIAATATVMCMFEKNKRFRRKTKKAVKAVSDIVDDLHSMMN